MTKEEQIKYHEQEYDKAEKAVKKLMNRICFKDSSPKAFAAFRQARENSEKHKKALDILKKSQ